MVSLTTLFLRTSPAWMAFRLLFANITLNNSLKFPLTHTRQTIPDLPASRLDADHGQIELEFTQITQTAALDSVASLPPAVDYMSALLPRVTISA